MVPPDMEYGYYVELPAVPAVGASVYLRTVGFFRVEEILWDIDPYGDMTVDVAVRLKKEE